jgi:hypothetical protein
MSDWSNELVLEFLELYQPEPTIYDPKHPAHKNKMKVNDLFIFHLHLLSLEWEASGVIAMCGRVHSPTNVRWIIRGRF